ncbi:hypothetical protein JH146_1516 [Methanocaldococcus bathoardescens]|uniref:DUF2341 domain-containing protein n=1 Tax=Methanocaldococcus bathoardescens TaxID=1301915 RepID=A0A076LIM4_9EURY|nr:DUF2341 domain-containing protein [Methanocaldococcus bathoardescens]AIJ06358.1 hypothetical protein JH146_1516 [Methanocaldococcus bathoardescens]
MFKKIKSNKGYIFTYEAVIVAFIFLSIFYVSYMVYSHNMLTAIEEKKDTEKFHKAVLLKDLYLKKYEFPGEYTEDYIQNFTAKLNLKEKTFDPCNNFTEDFSKFYFIIHSNKYDEMLDDAAKDNNFSLNKITFTFNGDNFTVYSNVTTNYTLPKILSGDTIVYFKENAYIPKITGTTKNTNEIKLYGYNGDHIYFKLDANVVRASARIIINNENMFSEWSGWKYASPILVINNLNQNLEGYCIKVVFDSAAYIAENQMNKNCSDIRFIDENGNELPYWIEPNTINTPHTVAWVKLDLAPKEHKIIYMLYGNPNAQSKSNGEATFLFFDDFSEKNLDKWNYNFNNPLFTDTVYNNGINYTYLNLDYSYYNIKGLTTDVDVHITTPYEYSSNISVRFHANFHKRYEEWGGFYHGNTIYDRQIISNYHWGGEYLRFESSKNNENEIEYRILPDSLYNTWHTYEIQRNGSNSVNLIINDNEFWSISNYIYPYYLPVSFYARMFDDSQNYGYIPPEDERNGNISIDWVFIRPYYEPEPTVQWFSSDVIFTVNGYVYRKPLFSMLRDIDITPNIKKGINKIEILNSPLPVEFRIETDSNTNFYYLTLSPRNITIMVKP